MNAVCACQLHGPGTPILQLMVHCLIQDKCDQLSVTMLQYFKEKGAELSGKITTQSMGLQGSLGEQVTYGTLDLLLSMQRIDCAKVVVEAGVDLMNGGSPGGEKFDVVPMFEEYCDHGTNEFICWAFNEYVPNQPEFDLKELTQQIVRSVRTMKEKDKRSCFWQSVRKAPAHAILNCRHEETVKHLIECGKKNGLDLLAERSCTGKTALHVAAEDNDMESVNILLQL